MRFIGRQEWLKRFRGYMAQEQGVIWRITGQPGIGKSMLLRRFEQDCAVEGQQHPNSWLDLENFTPAHGLDVLTTMAGAAQYFATEKANKGLKEKVGEGFKTVTGGLVSTLELAKDFIPGGELTAGAAKVVVGLGENLAGNAAQFSERQAAAHPELYLLDALAAAGAKPRKPVCLVDTYEHILRPDLKIKSRLLLEFKQAREGQEKEWLLSEWLGKLFDYLQSKGWRIVIVGRSIPLSQTNDHLPRFSKDEMLAAAKTRPALDAYVAEQPSALSEILGRLSFGGNPLWLQVAMNLLENLLAEGKDLTQLAQQPDYLQSCFEQPNPLDFIDEYAGVEHSSCKLSLIKTMTRPIAGLEEQAWKIALPRILDTGVVEQLFEPLQAKAILHNFRIAGVLRIQGQQFTLHEEIRDLLLAYANSKSWLETEETRALHGKLWEHLNQLYGAKEENYPAVWMLEAIYHRIFSGVGLLVQGINLKEFWWELSGSTLFSLAKKWHKAKALADLSAAEITALQDELIEKKRSLYEFIGPETVDKLSEDLRNSVIASPWEIQYWEQRVANYGLAGDYFVLIVIQKNPEAKIQMIDKFLRLYSESNLPKVQEQCAKALYSKGWTLGEKLNDPQGEIAVYDELLCRLGDSTVPQVQEPCAKALYSKGLTLGEKLNDPQGEITVYDELLHRFGDSIIPEVQERCAKALFYKGVTLGDKLNDPQAEIAVYDELLHRFGDSIIPQVQERCAKALFYKGVTLGDKLNDPQGEVAVYDELLRRFGDSTIPEVQEQCAKALYNKGVTLGEKFNDPQGEIEAYDELLHRFGDSIIPEVQERCAKALFYKGVTLGDKLNDPQAEITVYDELLHRFGDSIIPEVQERCAKALFYKGVTLGEKLNDPQGEVAVYDELLRRFGDSTIPEVQEQCAKALYNKGVTLGEKFNDPQGEIEAYDDLLRRFGDSIIPEVQEQCAIALLNKGMTLGEKLNDPQGTIAVYDELLRRLGDSTVPQVQEQCAIALLNKGVTLSRLGDLPEALVCCDDLLARYGDSSHSAIQAQCISALANMSEPLLVLGQREAAIQRMQQVLARVDTNSQEYAVMHFLLWLAEAETTIHDVLIAIRALTPDVQFTWNWSDIRPFIDKLPEPRKTQAECFIAFFAQHHDLAILERCLA